ncbi:MAG: hypothetical protein EAZ91_23980 [Cytophagales bacterium]|nr:MAG: hypothetical protein EAZ91_23980 [Cytophagales bacterium]
MLAQHSLIKSPFLTPFGDYRAIPRVSNSDLTRLKEEHLGYGNEASMHFATDKTRTFGKAFHQHLLEPETLGTVMQQLMPDLLAPGQLDPRLDARQSERLGHLMNTIRQDGFCRRYLRQSEKERVVLFTEPTTGVHCKARLDLVYMSPKRQNALVLDFKTTSARTQSQFLQSCYDYDYDRQAAFYFDSLRYAGDEWATTRQFRFVFVGVMKQSPHRLFAVDATSIPGFLDYGRKKYRFWLRKWQEQD